MPPLSDLAVDVISFQKIFGLCGLKCHIMEIWRDVTLDHEQRTHGRNVKIGLEFWKQNSQQEDCQHRSSKLLSQPF